MLDQDTVQDTFETLHQDKLEHIWVNIIMLHQDIVWQNRDNTFGNNRIKWGLNVTLGNTVEEIQMLYQVIVKGIVT